MHFTQCKRYLTTLTVLTLCTALVGCGGGGSGSLNQSNTNLVNPANFGNFNFDERYDANAVSQFLSTQEFQNVAQYSASANGSRPASSIHPYMLTNVHEAYGAGLSGLGVGIAVLDTGFNTPSQMSSNQAFGETLAKRQRIQFTPQEVRDATGESITAGSIPHHGALVSSIAAAAFDCTNFNNAQCQNFWATYAGAYPNSTFELLRHGMMGVAYNAQLFLADYKPDASLIPSVSDMASLTNGLAQTGAAVLNNSWGLNHPSTGVLLRLPTGIPSNIDSYSSREASDWLWNNTGRPWGRFDWSDYHSSLQRFQQNGAIVFALQNSKDSQPSLLASLPSIYTDLKPAWITVGNIDTRGTSAVTMSVSSQSAACGATAEYCVVVDGTELTGSDILSSRGYARGLSGTSLAAPQVSGMLALLTEAFKGQGLTPSDIVARLLATSNNKFPGFVAVGTRSFGGGVQHQYSLQFGHGIPDMRAALQPIETATTVLSFVTSGTPESGPRTPVRLSNVVSSPVFGDSIDRATQTKTALSFDALGGGFLIPLTSRVGHVKPRPALKAGSLPISSNDPSFVARLKQDVADSGELVLGARVDLLSLSQGHLRASYGTDHPNHWKSLQHRSIGSMSDKTQAAIGFQSSSGLSLISYQLQTSPSFETNPQELAQKRPNAYGLSLIQPFTSPGGSTTLGFLGFDLRNEDGLVKGVQSNGALRIGGGLQSFSLTPGFQWTSHGWEIKAMGSVSVNRPVAYQQESSLLQIKGNFYSTGALVEATRNNNFQNRDSVYIQLWQPERIEGVRLEVKTPMTSGVRDSIQYNVESYLMSPSGRELSLGAGYSWYATKNSRLALEVSITTEAGHRQQEPVQTSARLNWMVGF